MSGSSFLNFGCLFGECHINSLCYLINATSASEKVANYELDISSLCVKK